MSDQHQLKDLYGRPISPWGTLLNIPQPNGLPKGHMYPDLSNPAQQSPSHSPVTTPSSIPQSSTPTHSGSGRAYPRTPVSATKTKPAQRYDPMTGYPVGMSSARRRRFPVGKLVMLAALALFFADLGLFGVSAKNVATNLAHGFEDIVGTVAFAVK